MRRIRTRVARQTSTGRQTATPAQREYAASRGRLLAAVAGARRSAAVVSSAVNNAGESGAPPSAAVLRRLMAALDKLEAAATQHAVALDAADAAVRERSERDAEEHESLVRYREDLFHAAQHAFAYTPDPGRANRLLDSALLGGGGAP